MNLEDYSKLAEQEKAKKSREFQKAHAAKKNKRKIKLRESRPKERKRKAQKKQKQGVKSDAFLESYKWRKLRYQAIKKYGRRCQCCGRKPPEIVLNVDHIKPRKRYPLLALDIDNLQVLCDECNHGKGNWDETDWRSVDATDL